MRDPLGLLKAKYHREELQRGFEAKTIIGEVKRIAGVKVQT